ncbi:HlyD family secretion protein [Alterisphingorhabdus coralli]|uniref:HlyD family secretion protein n=1 Tax=Alterisphingorhabdus coralli TaxID=3071408 RepID=A0AA97F9U1_9SPHN|nr:HlyD family secretion protein [Parasphingorhabdus sp. SCSIO 66989]WOE75907.1 HlyD family secretion protein [Parasphingorhabdus sp. SCSIO 66989]
MSDDKQQAEDTPKDEAEEATVTEAEESTASEPSEAEKTAKRTGRGAMVLLGIIAVIYLLHFVGDRVTPYTSQARIGANVVPIAPQVAGEIIKLDVVDNQLVKKGDPLFEIDTANYELAQQKAEADLDAVGRDRQAASAAVEVARANLGVARAALNKTRKETARYEALRAADEGTVSVRRLDASRASLSEARSRVDAAEAQLRQAEIARGSLGGDNDRIRAARSALEKAQLDIERSVVRAPADGKVTDLSIDAGRIAGAGQPALTLISVRDVWVDADLTENNLGHVKVGQPVDIVLEAMPGSIIKGKVRSVGSGVAAGPRSSQGSLPTVNNSRDWLRPEQRFPVVIEFTDVDPDLVRNLRLGGQASVLVYTDEAGIMGFFGRLYIGFMALLSYVL